MQLTGPIFLFLLLPLSLLLLRIVPLRHRRLVLSLFSAVWYALINYGNVWGLLHIVLLLAFILLYVYLPLPHSTAIAKARTVIGVLVLVLSFLLARILAEYGNNRYVYPVGLAFITLNAISLVVDLARGDTVRPTSPVSVIGYVLFFPVLVAGPVIRSKHFFDNTEKPKITSERISIGARLYMMGFIKRIALAAVLIRALRQLMSYMEFMISLPLILLLLILSYFSFYFFFTGTTDMARGVCAMYGITTDRDRGHILTCTDSDRLTHGISLSLYHFMQDYVYHPLRRILPSKGARFWAESAVFALSLLFLRTRPEMLIFAIPAYLLLLPNLLQSRKRKRLYVRLIQMPFSILACSFFTLAIMMDEPLQMFSLIGSAFSSNVDFRLYHIFEAVSDFRYLLFALVVFLILLPLSYMRSWLLRKIGARTALVTQYVELTVLFICFALTLFYFMPQFPSYADQAYGMYQYTR